MSDISINVTTVDIEVTVSDASVDVDVQEQPIEIIVMGGVGPQGPPGNDGRDGLDSPIQPAVIWDQQVASDLWVVIHSWPGFPSVTVVDTSGKIMIGDVKYINATRIEITFSVPVSGKAYLN